MTAMALDLKEQTHDTRSHPKALTPLLICVSLEEWALTG